jgi:hypothetical protein
LGQSIEKRDQVTSFFVNVTRAIRTQAAQRELNLCSSVLGGELGDVQQDSLLIQKAGTHIGEVLDVLVNVLNPTRIMIGGGFATVGPTMLASICQACSRGRFL